MSDKTPASEESKTMLENNVAWYLADKINSSSPITTKKFMTSDNLLVYLTLCSVAETAVPRIKVQIFKRVQGGVQETGYQLFGDHRLKKYENAMIFGAASGSNNSENQSVSQTDLDQLLQFIANLQSARQVL